MLTERENMEICWNHEQPEWVPMINTASQMIICPEINDRPLFMSGKDDFGLDWEVDPAHPELMSHVSPTAELFDDITEWPDRIKFQSPKDKNWEAAAMRTKAMWAKKDQLQGYWVGNMGGFERICAMMGHVNGLMAPYDDEEAYADYVNAYADYRIEQFYFIKKYLDVDFLMMHDDWGNQNQMFMSPDMWRQFYKEPERRMAAAAPSFPERSAERIEYYQQTAIAEPGKCFPVFESEGLKHPGRFASFACPPNLRRHFNGSKGKNQNQTQRLRSHSRRQVG